MPGGIPLPPDFLERMSVLLGDEFPAFLDSLSGQAVTGLRENTLKIPPDEFPSRSPFSLGEPVPWAPSAFILPYQNTQPGLHPYHVAGLYYLQDPSAMAAAVFLDPQPGDRVLDLAAAPGGKATALASLMHGIGLLVVNEIKDTRLGHLVMNMERWAAPNVIITNGTPEELADQFGSYFNRVLVDAPCSGEGMFRKDEGARADWSPGMVKGCAQRQGNILRVAARLVRPGGTLLYSTCTFNPEENEEVILDFLEQHPTFTISALRRYPGFMPGRPDWVTSDRFSSDRKSSLVGAVRLFPHRVKGEGHFICSLVRSAVPNEYKRYPRGKKSQESNLREMDATQAGLWREFSRGLMLPGWDIDRLLTRGERLYYTPGDMPPPGSIRVASPGIWLGTFKKDRFEPAHPLALFLHASLAANVLDLKVGDPRLGGYLRGESINSPGNPGWTLVCVDGFGLGWGKRVQGVVKNHFPRGWLRQ